MPCFETNSKRDNFYFFWRISDGRMYFLNETLNFVLKKMKLVNFSQKFRPLLKCHFFLYLGSNFESSKPIWFNWFTLLITMHKVPTYSGRSKIYILPATYDILKIGQMENRNKNFYFFEVCVRATRVAARARFFLINAILHIIYGKILLDHIPTTETPKISFLTHGPPKWYRASDMVARAPKFLYQKMLLNLGYSL